AGLDGLGDQGARWRALLALARHLAAGVDLEAHADLEHARDRETAELLERLRMDEPPAQAGSAAR
ncbi:MAG: hypothetical protein HYU66_06245, partial [Armatimonadetes bacterium]|nr:hypothetical protein [Armatimonadota bacterium]